MKRVFTPVTNLVIKRFANELIDAFNRSSEREDLANMVFLHLEAYLNYKGYSLSCQQQGIKGTILSVNNHPPNKVE